MPPESASQRPGAQRPAPAGAEETSPAELEALAEEVAQVPPLRPGELPRLLERIQAGSDEAAVARLLETHLAVVLELANARKGRGLPVGDLFQEGSVGLLSSIRAFPAAGDPDFDSFSAAQVALAMEDAIRAEAASLEQERLLVEAAADYDRVEMKLAGELKRAPTTEEIGKRLEWSVARTQKIREIVEEARRQHDEDLLQYVDPDDLTDLGGEGEIGLN